MHWNRVFNAEFKHEFKWLYTYTILSIFIVRGFTGYIFKAFSKSWILIAATNRFRIVSRIYWTCRTPVLALFYVCSALKLSLNVCGKIRSVFLPPTRLLLHSMFCPSIARCSTATIKRMTAVTRTLWLVQLGVNN